MRNEGRNGVDSASKILYSCANVEKSMVVGIGFWDDLYRPIHIQCMYGVDEWYGIYQSNFMKQTRYFKDLWIVHWIRAFRVPQLDGWNARLSQSHYEEPIFLKTTARAKYPVQIEPSPLLQQQLHTRSKLTQNINLIEDVWPWRILSEKHFTKLLTDEMVEASWAYIVHTLISNFAKWKKKNQTPKQIFATHTHTHNVERELPFINKNLSPNKNELNDDDGVTRTPVSSYPETVLMRNNICFYHLSIYYY